MNELTSGIVSSAVWDLIKKGTSVTKDFLKNKLSNWILDDKSLDKICKYINNTPDVYLKSEGLLKEYINIDEEIQKELEFARYLSDNGKKMWIRQVLVPGYTDDEKDLLRLKDFISTLKTVEKVQILKYHSMGKYKWEKLGLKYELEGIRDATLEDEERAKKILGIQ